jgi:hypothetical protein
VVFILFLCYITVTCRHTIVFYDKDCFSNIKTTSVVVHQKIFYQIIKINKTKILLKYFFGARGVQFLEKRRENVQILQALRWRFDVWEGIVAVKKRCTTTEVLNFFENRRNIAGKIPRNTENQWRSWRHNDVTILNTVCVHWNQEKNSVHAVLRQRASMRWKELGTITAIYGPIFNRRTACTEFFSWFQCTQTVFKKDTIIYRNKLFIDEFYYLVAE